MTQILDGKLVASGVLAKVKEGVDVLRAKTGTPPALAVVLVGDFAPSKIYVKNKKAAAEKVGIASHDYLFPEGLTEPELLALLRRLNKDRSIHGILLQLPLPAGLQEDVAIEAILPEKDVDGLTPTNLGYLLAGEPRMTPCTPGGVMEILDFYGIDLKGAEAVVVGRSRLVGKPLGHLLLARHATVTFCHTRTRDLASHTRRADLLAVAAGRAQMISGEMVKEGAVVIDVGQNLLESGKLVGDVAFESAAARAKAITPVPGGVGPMTIAMLMKNTLLAAQRQLNA
jgi:methylenetetrahydrofolate dehydrogenase (NADP+)/methenyltetrahydrofolate cyclohydrolase